MWLRNYLIQTVSETGNEMIRERLIFVWEERQADETKYTVIDKGADLVVGMECEFKEGFFEIFFVLTPPLSTCCCI